MRKAIALCLLLMFTFCAVGYANLDAPAEKKITVRSEIKRGKDAVEMAERSVSSSKPLEFIEKVNSIIHTNRQNNTDTDAFYMGVYGQAWINTTIMCKVINENKDLWKGVLTDGQIKSLERETAWYYKQFRLKQKELDINDEDLKKLFTFRDEWLTEWDKRTAN